METTTVLATGICKECGFTEEIEMDIEDFKNLPEDMVEVTDNGIVLHAICDLCHIKAFLGLFDGMFGSDEDEEFVENPF